MGGLTVSWDVKETGNPWAKGRVQFIRGTWLVGEGGVVDL